MTTACITFTPRVPCSVYGPGKPCTMAGRAGLPEPQGRSLWRVCRLVLQKKAANICGVRERWYDVQALEVVDADKPQQKRAWPRGVVLCGKHVLGTWETMRL